MCMEIRDVQWQTGTGNEKLDFNPVSRIWATETCNFNYRLSSDGGLSVFHLKIFCNLLEYDISYFKMNENLFDKNKHRQSAVSGARPMYNR